MRRPKTKRKTTSVRLISITYTLVHNTVVVKKQDCARCSGDNDGEQSTKIPYRYQYIIAAAVPGHRNVVTVVAEGVAEPQNQPRPGTRTLRKDSGGYHSIATPTTDFVG